MCGFSGCSSSLTKEAHHRDPAVASESHRTTSSSTNTPRILHASKRFKTSPALDNVTFGVPSGQILALLGPNSAGKTTLLSLIRGDIKASSSNSQILVAGADIRSQRLAARRAKGTCPQHNALGRLTVSEHLRFYARIHGVPSPASNVSAVIETMGLSPPKDRTPGKLSGGNQRKSRLATAIIGSPRALLLDEPSSGLDAVSVRVMWEAIRTVQGIGSLGRQGRREKGCAHVLTTHSMEEPGALASRTAILDQRVLACGSVSEVVSQHSNGRFDGHLVLTDGADEEKVGEWIATHLLVAGDLASAEAKGGQMRFRVSGAGAGSEKGGAKEVEDSAILPLISLLETHRQELRISHYSVSPATLESVFLDTMKQNRGLDRGNRASRLSMQTEAF